MTKLHELIGFNKGNFVIGSHDLSGHERNGVTAAMINDWSRDVSGIIRSISDMTPEDHSALAAAVVEPISKLIPYSEMYGIFFQDATYGELEDNAIPVEDVVAIAWETHQDGEAYPVRSGFSWTRPGFTTLDTAIELPWHLLRKAGWNVFARQMQRATENLARLRDAKAKGILEAALLPSHIVTVSGGALTKAAVDTVVKGAADIGFPVMRALVNPGTLKDMTDFVWPTGVFLPEKRVEQLIQNLFLTNYAGIEWYVNPNFPTNQVMFSGMPSVVGWHQLRGGVRNANQTDVRNKLDFYLIEDAENAWFVGNELSLWQIKITA